MKELLGILVLVSCIGVYAEKHSDTVSSILDDGKELCSSVKTAASDASGLINRIYQILGDPKQNWQTGIDGMVAVGRENGNIHPTAATVDNSRIYDMLNVDNLRNSGYGDLLVLH